MAGSDSIGLYQYRAPSKLDLSGHGAKKALLIGSCTVVHTQGPLEIHFGVKSHFVHIASLHGFNWDNLDDDFDFQITSIPMDHLLPRHIYFLDNFNSLADAEKRFERACGIIESMLDSALSLNRTKGLLTFVCNLLVPQQNPQGRLLPRYDLRNPIHFVEELNKLIACKISANQNAYLIDIDSVSATFGRMRIQDDSIWSLSHGGPFSNLDYDIAQKFLSAGHNRIEPIPRVGEATYAQTDLFWWTIASEVIASYKTVRQRDQVKAVIIDLDDTLWRGVAVDPVIDDASDMLEGIPFGFIETLLFLESRGIALAIVSKNDEDRVLSVWNRLLARYFDLSKFVSVKINWLSKADNILVIAGELNIGLNSIVFVDDHPREREEVATRLPEVRVLGSDVYSLRRDLLWSPETQVRAITEEYGRRTQMLKSQIEREQIRLTSSREEFLASLDLHVRPMIITDRAHRSYERSLELINKTNQFNTTGVRWDVQDITSLFARGGYLVAFSASDRTTDYGTICVAIVVAGRIEIFVMSCRVIGLGIEIAALRLIERFEKHGGRSQITSRPVATEKNTLSRDLFERGGFVEASGVWTRDLGEIADIPSHITIDDMPAVPRLEHPEPSRPIDASGGERALPTEPRQAPAPSALPKTAGPAGGPALRRLFGWHSKV